MEYIKECMRSREVGMKNNLLWKSIVICFKTCPFDALLLIVVSVLLSVSPAIILLVYNNLIQNVGMFSLACIWLLLYCFVLFFKKSIYNFYNHYFLNYRTLLKFEKGIKCQFFDICADLKYEDYLHPEIVNETKRAQNASVNIFRLYQICVEIVSAIIGVLAIGTSIVAIDISLIVFLLLSVISPVIDNIYKIIQKKYLLYNNTQLQREEQEISDLLTKSQFLKEIIELNVFSFVYRKWNDIQNSIINEKLSSEKKIVVVSFLMNLVRIIATSIAYYSVTNLFIDAKIDIAEFSMIILTFSQITQIFNQIFSLFGNLSEFTIMVIPFFEFIERIGDKKEEKVADKNNSIILNNVSFKYPSSKETILKNINLHIRKGELISIVGENGSGKTTLSNIIMGFLTPTEGTVANFVSKNGDSIFDNITLIPQEFNCYSTSIINNITFGKEILGFEILDMLKAVGLTEIEDILYEDYGLEFGGAELSGGQKQKIAILRGLYKKCDLLICDEPTSSIDPIQESIINRKLLKVSQDYTTVIISHRLALTKYSDRIIVLNNGEIVEDGCHEELIARDGLYSELWNSQSMLYSE